MKNNDSKTQNGISRKLRDAIAAFSLKRLARALCLGTVASEEASDEILYGLPGIFSMEISAAGARVRLIKEANTLRIMRSSEKSEPLLRLHLEDLAVLGDIVGRECTLQKALAEGRMTFAGKTTHLATIMRASAAGDKTVLPNEEYCELYGKKKED